jgi:hypothetical protein
MPTLHVHRDDLHRVRANAGAANWFDQAGSNTYVGGSVADLRFGAGSHFTLGATIVQGSTINSATFTCVGVLHAGSPIFKVKIELASSPAALGNLADYMSRRGLILPLGVVDIGLVASLWLDLSDHWGAGDYPYDVAAILQEVVSVYAVDKVVIFVDDHDGRSAAGANVNQLGDTTLDVDWTPFVPVIPVVTTQAATAVDKTTTTMNGTITAINDTEIVEYGFVYGLASQPLPGDVAPAAAGYTNWASTVGHFGLGAFNAGLAGLTPGTLYYFRAYGKNDLGHYAYGAEVIFITFSLSLFYLLGSILTPFNAGGRHYWLDGSSTIGSPTWDTIPGIFALPCFLTNFKFTLTTAPGLGGSQEFTLCKNGIATAVVLSFGPADVYKEDLVSVVTANEGDRFTWSTNIANSGAYTNAYWSIEVAPNLADMFPLQSGQTAAYHALCYANLLGNDDTDGSAVDTQKVSMPCDGKLKRFHARIRDALGVNSWTLTLYKNNVATAIVALITGVNLTWANNVTEISFVAGDVFYWKGKCTGGAYPGWGNHGCVVEIAGGGIPRMDSWGLTTQNAAVRYKNLHSIFSSGDWTAVSAPAWPTVPVKMGCKALCLSLETAPGAGKYWELEFVLNGLSTGLKARCSNAETLKVVAGNVLVPIGSAPGFKLTPGGSPAMGYTGASLLLGSPPSITGSITGLPKSQVSRVPRVQSVYT